MALQGTRWKSAGTFQRHGWTITTAEAAGPNDGVLVAVRRTNGAVRASARLAGRILETRWRRKGAPIVFFTCYAPGARRPAADNHHRWRQLWSLYTSDAADDPPRDAPGLRRYMRNQKTSE